MRDHHSKKLTNANLKLKLKIVEKEQPQEKEKPRFIHACINKNPEFKPKWTNSDVGAVIDARLKTEGVKHFMELRSQVKKAQKYFWALGYDLPEGESLADWLIDISTGSLKPAVLDDSSEDDDSSRNKKQSKKERKKGRRQNKSGVDTSDEEDDAVQNMKKYADSSSSHRNYLLLDG